MAMMYNGRHIASRQVSISILTTQCYNKGQQVYCGDQRERERERKRERGGGGGEKIYTHYALSLTAGV